MEESLELRESDQKLSSCSICGIFRRRALDYAAKDQLVQMLLATGHNLR